MRTLTRSEVGRTAFRRVSEKQTSTFGHTHPGRDKNEMCPYCKNEDTEVIRDKAYLSQFAEFYGEKQFSVIHCSCCSAVFSFPAK